MLAPGIAPPEESVTTPVIVPALPADCACAALVRNKNANTMRLNNNQCLPKWVSRVNENSDNTVRQQLREKCRRRRSARGFGGNKWFGRARRGLRGDPAFRHTGGDNMNRYRRLYDRQVSERTNVASTAGVILMEMGRRRR
jgi:hypothetical protein